LDLDFKEALATLSRGLPAALIRAAVLAAGGFSAIIVFGMLLFARRFAGGSSIVLAIIAMAAVLAWAASGLAVQRLFLFRYRAVMLLLFSGRVLPAAGLATAVEESRGLFGSYSRWRALNKKLRRALSISGGLSGQISKITPQEKVRRLPDFGSNGIVAQAVMALALSRGGADIMATLKEGLVLAFGVGAARQRLAKDWMLFSIAGLASIFVCLALPNWLIFSGAGAPVWIGIALSAAIAVLLHQAFVVPFVLAGLSGALLNDSHGRTADRDLIEKVNSLFSSVKSPGKNAD
jgi:hypothetical protein